MDTTSWTISVVVISTKYYAKSISEEGSGKIEDESKWKTYLAEESIL